MQEQERDQMIATLILITGWKPEAFTGKSDREIIGLYDRYMKLG